MTAPTFPRINTLTARALMRLLNLTIEAVKCLNCGIACGDVIGFTLALHGLQFAEDISTLIAQA